MVIIVFLLIVAFTGRASVPYPDDAGFTTHVERRLQGPTRDNLFGTDEYGRDVFTRTVWATQTSLIAGEGERCAEEEPVLKELSDGHLVACHLYD